MDYKETDLSFLYEDLLRELVGEKKAESLYSLMCQKYTELCKNEKKFENDEMNKHIFKRILPTISIYIILLENGFNKNKALAITHNEIQRDAFCKAEENAKLTKMPFTYSLFKTFAKSHMKKKYPIEGFTVEWKRHDCKEIHFDIVRCLYKEMCEKYRCSELCTVFCQSDITAFAGYEPKIRFERLGTIGEGASRCDFHFIKAK